MLAKGKNVSKVSVSSKSSRFIPNADDWARFYKKWFGKFVWALHRRASKETVEDGVEEAFLKLQGLSSERHLEQELQPLTESGWFRYILQQAEWIISQERDRDSRWCTDARTINEVSLKMKAIGEDSQLTPQQRELALRNHRQLLGCLVELEGDEKDACMPCDRLDGNLMELKIQALMDEMRVRHGISEKVLEAYRRYVLDEEPPAQVVVAVWGATDSEAVIAARKNNLFQIKNRINGYLLDFVSEWKLRGGDLRSFLEAA